MNLDFGIRGKVKATVTDIRDGSKRVVKKDNLVLDSLMNSWFTSNRVLISAATMHMCYLGTSSTPPSPTDTGVQGTVLASSSAGTTLHIDGPRAELPALSALPGDGQGCAFSPDGKYLAAAHASAPYITVYDVEDGFTKLPALSALPGNGQGCAFSPDGKYLAAAHASAPYITVYDVEDGFTKLPALSALPGTGYACAFSPDGKYLAVAHYSSPRITVYDVEDGFTKLPALSAPSGIGRGCAFSPDGKYLAVAHDDAPYITVYDVEDNFTKLPALSALPGNGQGCAFSPDGKYLAVAHNDAPRITVYDVEDNFTKLPALSTLPGTGKGCSFSPDGKYLAVAHYLIPPGIIVYDVENDFTKHPALLALPGIGNGCDFSPDGKYLAVAHNDAPYITVYEATNPKYATQRSIVRRWVFPPGTGTGEIGELVLRTSTSGVWASRVAFELPIVKTEFHELEVEWQMTVHAEPLTTNTIQNGQIDGSTDVVCTFEYLPHMFHNITRSNGHTPWFGITGTPALSLGDGAGTYDFGEGNGILGTQFARYVTSAIREVSPYVTGSLERTFRIFLETDQGNAPISEMALEGFGRIVFNPPLEKVDTHRLYVDVSLSFSREGE